MSFGQRCAQQIVDLQRSETRRLPEVQPPAGWLPTEHGPLSGPITFVEPGGTRTESYWSPYGYQGALLFVLEPFRLAAELNRRFVKVLSEDELRTVHYEGKSSSSMRFGRLRRAHEMTPRISRSTIRVISVRMARVQEITEEEAVRSGMPPRESASSISARDLFIHHWNTGMPDGNEWNANPWVWVYHFCRL